MGFIDFLEGVHSSTLILDHVEFGIPLHDCALNEYVTGAIPRYNLLSPDVVAAHTASMHQLHRRVSAFISRHCGLTGGAVALSSSIVPMSPTHPATTAAASMSSPALVPIAHPPSPTRPSYDVGASGAAVGMVPTPPQRPEQALSHVDTSNLMYRPAYPMKPLGFQGTALKALDDDFDLI